MGPPLRLLLSKFSMIEIRRMTIEDLPLGLRLARQAGWNQTKSDWRRFLNMEPEGCFVAELNGSSVGTTATCVFGEQAAWIAMVLVDRDMRGRGIGTKLLKHALDYLKARKIGTIRLDATPAGRPIYEKLGFVPEYELARFEGTVHSVGVSPPVPRKESLGQSWWGQPHPTLEATPDVFSDLIEFDHRMTGTDRAKMLRRLFEELPENIRIASQGHQLEGFITLRPGANAVQVGPCIATANAGPSLLCDALDRCEGKSVYVDIPLANECAVEIAQSRGLQVQRCFTRMCLGKRISENVQALWASSGPEKG
jgi:GNAT superfamily N-acetyltransferase